MNPGLLREPLILERPGTARDELGQPLDSWTTVGEFRGRRLKPKVMQDMQEVVADRERERRKGGFRVRCQPFLGQYQAGDRLREYPRQGMEVGAVWDIRSWTEVDGTNGAYIDLAVEQWD